MRRTAGVVVAALVLLAAGGASPAAALSPASQSHITEITEHLYRGSQFVQSCGTGSVCTELWSAEQALDASTADGEAILRGLRTLRQKIGVLPSFGDGSCIDFPTNRDFAGWYTFGSRPVYYKLGSIRRQDASPGSLFATWWKACMRRTPHNLDFGASLHASGWVAEVMYNFNLYRRWFGNGCFLSGLQPPPTYALKGPVSATGNCSGSNGVVPTTVFYAWRDEFSLPAAGPPEDYIGGATQPTSMAGPGVIDPGFSVASQRALAALTSAEFEDVARWYDVALAGKPGGAGLLGPPLDGNPSSVGDPVNSVTGNVYEAVEDFSIPARGLPLQFARFYNSLGPGSAAAAMGPGWTHSFAATAEEQPNGDVELSEPTGARFTFAKTGASSFASPAGVRHELSRVAGDLVLQRANGVTWRFASSGELESVVDLNGNEISLGYSGGRLSSVEDPAGRALTFAYDGAGRLASVEDWAGRTVQYEYDTSGRLQTVTAPDGKVTTYGYGTGDRLTSVNEPGSSGSPGRTRSYEYDAQGRAVVAEADNHTDRIELTYQPSLGRTLIRDSKGNQSTFYYDASGRITRIVDPDGYSQHLEWDSAGNNTAIVDQAGARTDMDYDADGNLIEVRQPDTGLGRPTTSFEYGSFGRVTKITDPRGAETDFAYDTDWNLETETDPLERETGYTRNAHGQVTAVTLPDGEDITTGYDANGYPATITDERGKLTELDHDALGRLVERTDPRGNSTSWTYDTADRVLTQTDPPAQTGDPAGVTTYAYDARGDLASVEDPEGHETLFEHDRHHRRTALEDATGRRTTFAYDTEGNLTSSVSPWSATTSYEYDKQRRLIKATEPDGTPQGAVTSRGYTATGLLASITDPRNHTTEFDYDAAGRLRTVTDPDGEDAHYGYSQRDELISSTDPAGYSTTYTYDLAGQLTAKALDRPAPAADPTWTWTYTDTGQIDTETDPDNRTTSHAYDPAGNPTTIDYPGSADDLTYSYDDAGNLTSAATPGQTTAFSYDALDRVIEEDVPGPGVIERAWDGTGLLTGLELPGSDSRSFDYDAAGRPTTITAANGTTSYSYDTGGRLDTIQFPRAGERTEYDYDPLGRITTVSDWRGTGQPIDQLSYGYDKASNTTSITSNADTAVYSYDALDRLTQETHTAGTPALESYTYDPAGNRLSATRDSQTYTYTYDTLGRLTQAGATTYTYNDTGEQLTATTNGQTTNYTWRPNGQLAAVDLPGSTPDLTYGYDPLDHRTTITRGSAVTSRLFVDDEIAQSTDTTGTRQLIRDPANRLLADSASGQHRAYHLDATGNVRTIVNNVGTLVGQYDYNAFGQPRTTTPEQGWLGQELDPATGLYDFRARAYDPATGRFTSRDPIAGDVAQPGTLNPYQYGYNNPLAYQDTSGLFSIPGVGWDYMSQKLHGGIDAVMQGYADVFCDSCSYINTKYGTKDFSLPHAFALGVLDASPARLFKLAKKTYEGARAGYRAASGAAKAGDSVLDSLTPLVRSNVDDAVKRAASGKVRFPGHDGKPYKNSDGSLPAGGNYTEWTAAGAGAKRGAHRVIIDGDPANPNAIYYWDHVKPPVRIGP